VQRMDPAQARSIMLRREAQMDAEQGPAPSASDVFARQQAIAQQRAAQGIAHLAPETTRQRAQRADSFRFARAAGGPAGTSEFQQALIASRRQQALEQQLAQKRQHELALAQTQNQPTPF